MQSPATSASKTSVSSTPRRLLVVRLGSMGDIIHTLPAVTAMRRAFPEASIGWIVEERWAELLCTLPEPRSGPRSPRRPLVDRIHTVNTKTWRRSLFSTQTWEQIAAGLSELRAQRYEVAVDFQGAARSALLTRWSGAPTVYGFAQPRENVASMLYSRQVIARGSHIVEQNLSLAEAVASRPLEVSKIEFPCDDAIEKQYEVTIAREWRFCVGESGRRLGRKTVAGGALRRSGEAIGGRWSEVAH